jgi:hypothetical protein
MIPVWSPEAINGLVALRAYIEQDDPKALNASRFTTSGTSNNYFRATPRWDDPAGFRGPANA